jgi:hypothetical protein
MYHILSNPGAGGDMVTAVIDIKDHQLNDNDVQCVHGTLRQKLKWDLINNKGANNLLYYGSKKTSYLEEIEKEYTAITCSHDFSIELQHVTDTILIDDSEYKYAKWCMQRCYIILPESHLPFNDDEVQHRIQKIKMVKKYGNINKIIPMKDILEGRLIEKLQQWISTPLNTEVYNHWLNISIAPLPKVDK